MELKAANPYHFSQSPPVQVPPHTRPRPPPHLSSNLSQPSAHQPTLPSKRTAICPKCTEQNLQDCSHCVVCGESGHRAVGCLKRTKFQGNWNRPLSRETDTQPQSQPVKPASTQPTKPLNKQRSKQTRKQAKRNRNKSYASSCQSTTSRKVPLVGKKSLLKCLINGYPVTVLFDSGSQVSIVDRQWAKTHIHSYPV